MAAVRAKEMSEREAARKWELPKTTLHDYVKMVDADPNFYVVHHRSGRHTFLSPLVEARIKESAVALARRGRGLSFEDVAGRAESIYRAIHNIPTETELLMFGRKWFKGFLERNHLKALFEQMYPQKRVGSLSKERAEEYNRALNDAKVGTIDRHHLWNMDETSIAQVRRRLKVVTDAGAPAPKARQITYSYLKLIVCVNAAGQFMPTTLLVQRHEVTPEVIETARFHGFYLLTTERGSLTRHWFAEWIKNCFIPSLPRASDHVLVMDNDSSHHSMECEQELKDASVIDIFLPPNTTDVLQPLDVAYFAPFKSGLAKMLHGWRTAEAETDLLLHELIPLIAKAQDSLHHASLAIKNGFRRCGLFPLDDSKFQNAVQTLHERQVEAEQVSAAALAQAKEEEAKVEDDVCAAVLTEGPAEPKGGRKRRGRPPAYSRVKLGYVNSAEAARIRRGKKEYDKDQAKRDIVKERRQARAEGREPASWAKLQRKRRRRALAVELEEEGDQNEDEDSVSDEDGDTDYDVALTLLSRPVTTRSGRHVKPRCGTRTGGEGD